VRVHETGTPLPDISRARAVVFWLADPLRELYPECFAEATAVASIARERGLRIVNPPESLSNTIKSVQAQRWQAAGVPCAAARPFRTPAELVQLLAGTRFPAIVRCDQLHSQHSAFYCASPDDARAVASQRDLFPGVVLSFVDTREGYERLHPDSIWARFYHKQRAMVFGDEVLGNHVYFSADPICGLKRSTFGRYLGRGARWSWLARVRPTDRAAIAADDAFWRSPVSHADVVRRATRALGLDMAAIDYSTTADGQIILWEANPYYDLPPAREGALPRERHLEQKISGFYRAIGRYFATLMGEEP
jgi:hypothetical protein